MQLRSLQCDLDCVIPGMYHTAASQVSLVCMGKLFVRERTIAHICTLSFNSCGYRRTRSEHLSAPAIANVLANLNYNLACTSYPCLSFCISSRYRRMWNTQEKAYYEKYISSPPVESYALPAPKWMSWKWRGWFLLRWDSKWNNTLN